MPEPVEPASLRAAPSSVPPAFPLRKVPRPSARPKWAFFAVVMALLVVVLEGVAHLCASIFFDPLPDIITGIAYAWVIFFLGFNEAVLATPRRNSDAPIKNRLIRWLGPRRATGIAIAGTSVALLIAGMATWMFLPFILAAPFLIATIIGSLLLVPCFVFIVLIVQWFALQNYWQSEAGAWDKRVTRGTALLGAAASFFLIVRPGLIGTYTAQALSETGPTQQRAFTGLRLLRGEQAMLDLTYHRSPSYWVSFGYNAPKNGLWPWTGYSWYGLGDDEARSARRTYFLLTGTPFESVPRPASAARQNPLDGIDDVAIEETGGMVVGRPVPGLSLDASALKFTTDARTETAEGSWTLTFRNDTDAAQEARADILLPYGATCHAVSLWVNGVEKPAAFGSPQKVRVAYQQVAVVQRRDPLLVTMPAPDHLLAQCFPVPAYKTMKIKLGITAPLVWRKAAGGLGQLSFATPAFGPVNFDVPSGLTHHLTVLPGSESHTHLAGPEIFTPRHLPVATARTAPKVGDVLAPGVVRMSNPLASPSRPVTLYLLFDASEGMNDLLTPDVRKQLQSALASLPVGSQVHFFDTSSPSPSKWAMVKVSPSLQVPWERLRLRFTGGADPAPALAKALRRPRSSPHAAAVVFLHAASPANVSDLKGVRSELQANANGRGPALVSIQLAPRAQDAVAMELAGFSGVYARRALPGAFDGLKDAIAFAAQAADAHRGDGVLQREYACPLGGQAPAASGITFADSTTTRIGSVALSRLYQAGLTRAGWYAANAIADPEKALDVRIVSGRPAAVARLVTPLSSAVVLETQEDYKKNGLDDKDGKKGYVKKEGEEKESPNVNAPEPGTGFLLGAGLLAVPFLRRRRNKSGRQNSA